MLKGSTDLLPQKSLQVKNDNKFFSKLLSKESSRTNSSFRVYYGVASVGVPFMWESQPGTPKNPVCDTSLPPLTPPPSHHFSSEKKPIKKPLKFNLIHTIFPRLTVKKTRVSASRYSTPSSSSSPTSKQTSPRNSSFDSRGDDEEMDFGSPTSTLCFGLRRETHRGFRGCYSMVIMSNPLSSISGHGSGRGTSTA